MKKRSRRYREIKQKILENKRYSLAESWNFLHNNNQEKVKNIKVSFSLNWANQKNVLKTKVILPHAISPKNKIVVIKEDLPTNIVDSLAGNNQVELLTITELRQRIEEKKKSQWGFSKVLVHPNNESKIKTGEKLLGPKGLYPTKKNGWLTENILEEVKKFQQGEQEIKTDKGGNIHVVIGNDKFSSEQLEENYNKIYNKIVELRPVGWKGDFLKNITLSTTMGPGLKVLL